MATIKQIISILLFPVFLCLPFSSNASIVILNGLSHDMKVKPGETYRGTVEIQNTKSTPQAVKLYPRDYSFSFNGEAFYDEPGSLPRSNSNWIAFSPSYLVLSPKEKTAVTFEVKVPATESLQGTYWSVLMVEGEAPVDDNKLSSGLTIQTQVRYAVQIATTVESVGERNLSFLLIKPATEGGNHSLTVDIENKGDYLIKPEVSLELYDAQGVLAGMFTAARRKLYPNTSARFIIELQGITSGTYQALVLADGGGEDIFGINLVLDLTDD